MSTRAVPRAATGGLRRLIVAVVLMQALVVLVPIAATSARTAGAGPAVAPSAWSTLLSSDLARPRLIMRAGDLPLVQDRLNREPYRTLLHDIQARAEAAPPPNEADQADCVLTPQVNREFLKDRAGMDLAFLYLVDRVSDPVTGDAVAPSAEQRQAIGDRVRDYLRFMCTESRIKIQFDRDISTSHELLSSAAAYDALAGAGYDFVGHEPEIIDNLATLTTEFASHYNDPTNPNYNIAGMSLFATNNHRSKGAASIGVAALALAGSAIPDVGSTTWRDPAKWLDFGLDRVDLVQRYTYGAGDGGYGEGLLYWRFASENVVPFAHAWDRLVDGQTVQTAAGVTIPSLWRQPQFARMQQWALDLTLPDGTLAPIDDSKVGERGHFGLFPADFPGSSALGWRWANATVPFESENNIDMAPFQIVTYDDSTAKQPVSGSGTRFYTEGGNVVFRSDWSTDAVMVAIQGEHGAARELGRDREGLGELWSAAHDHADPGAYLMQAYGERLLLDPGYMDFPWSQHRVLNKPGDHNLVMVDPLVEPQSPVNPFPASAGGAPALAFAQDPDADYPADGNAQISDPLDVPGLAGATVSARYGSTGGAPAVVQRRFLFVDDAYLITADTITSPVARTYTWPINGNGGGHDGVLPLQPALTPAQAPPEGVGPILPTAYAASGGTFTQTASGAEWTRPAAHVTTGMAFDGGTPTATTEDRFYEQKRSALGQYTALLTRVSGADVRAVGVEYPTPTSQAAPVIERGELDGAAVLTVDDPAGDRRVFVLQREPGAGLITVPASVTGSRALTTDGSLVVLDTTSDGTVRSVSAENATAVEVADGPSLRSPDVATLSVRIGQDTADVTARPGVSPTGTVGATAPPGPLLPPGTAELSGLPFTVPSPDAASLSDGPACSVGVDGGRISVPYTRDGVVRLGRDDLTSVDPGGPMRVAAGGQVELDGSRTCGAESGDLRPHWEITSAPPDSSWTLTGADGWTPTLHTEVVGPYRVRLTVTDGSGASVSGEVLVLAGRAGRDGLDNDLDGRYDGADPDGDTVPPLVVEPPTTTTTTSSTSSTTTSTGPTTTVDPGSSSTTASVAAGGTERGAGGGGGTDDPSDEVGATGTLPATGASTLEPLAIGLALVVVGLLLTAVTRRRRLADR